jgi:hypothetical protein
VAGVVLNPGDARQSTNQTLESSTRVEYNPCHTPVRDRATAPNPFSGATAMPMAYINLLPFALAS